MAHTLPQLSFAYNALEPFIDVTTMTIHHTKHHQAYIDKLNAAVKETPLVDKPLDELLKDLNSVPETIRTAVRNNGGGHWNHSFFWTLLAPSITNTPNIPNSPLADAINKKFTDFENFKKEFAAAAIVRFGSGWAWLVTKDHALNIISTPNQDNPLMDSSGTPILGLDIWEHAYYLKYQNRRQEYIEAWWNVVNWKQVDKNFTDSSK